jgi:hypothetical protein
MRALLLKNRAAEGKQVLPRARKSVSLCETV